MDLLIIDDFALHRESLTAHFAAAGAQVRTAWDLPSLYGELERGLPDVVLLNRGTRDSANLLRATVQNSRDVRVIVVGVSEDNESEIVACAEAGVAGYHLRSDSLEDLFAVVQRVVDGESACSPRVAAILLRRLSELASERPPTLDEAGLTTREAQILRMLEMGLSNRQIASRLCIAVHTVKNHVHSILTKLGVQSRAEAAAHCRAIGYAADDESSAVLIGLPRTANCV